MAGLNLAVLMETRVTTVSMDDDLETAHRLMSEGGFHHLPVVDDGRLVGMVSDRDVLRRLSPFIDKLAERPQDSATRAIRVHALMARKLLKASPSDDVEVAARIMIEGRVSCVPLVGPRDELLGIVTWRDLLEWAFGVPRGIRD